MITTPHILARVAALPYSALHRIAWRSSDKLNKYLSQFDALESEQKEVLATLKSLVHRIENYPAKFYLKIILRDIYNGRNIKVKPFDYHGKFEKEFAQVLVDVVKLKESKVALEQSKKMFSKDYNDALIELRKELKQLAGNPDLRLGLQLASHSFVDRLDRYLEKVPFALNKKTFQTERKLLQYLSRMATKTSPFSSFTKLALLDLNGQVLSTNQRKVRLNNSLFQLFRDALIHYPAFFQNLEIRLNSSLETSDDQFAFLLNTRNIESVQRIEKDELLQLIIDLLNEERSFTFRTFIDELIESIEADRDALENHIRQLIEYGLIEWEWSISGLDASWPQELQASLEDVSDDLLVSLRTVLVDVDTLVLDFERGDFEHRKEAQDLAFQKLKKISDDLLTASGLKDKTQVATSRDLKNVLTTRFNLTKEKIFYEDVSQAFLLDKFEPETVESICSEIDRLTKVLSPLFYNSNKEKHLAFYKKKYSNERVPLLKYYEDYFKNPIRETPQSESDVIRHKDFLNQLIEKGNWRSSEDFHLDWTALPDVKDSSKEEHLSKGSLIQLVENEGKTKAFVDAVFMGYGKYFGRFLYLFPESVTESLRNENVNLQGEELWIENTDASIFNPNVHPSLMQFEIESSNSQNNLPASQRIQISDLEIGSVPKQKYLGLFQRSSARRIHIFDYGFEALNNRSPMYQLLSIFNYELTGPSVLVGMLENHLQVADENGVIRWPRISVGEHLILKRRGWGIPKENLPVKNKNTSDAEYFLAVQHWKRKLGLPDQVFIRIDPSTFRTADFGRPKSDDYKPQFMDFSSPLLVQLFGKLILRVPTVLEITEALPEISGEGNAVEYLVEWV